MMLYLTLELVVGEEHQQRRKKAISSTVSFSINNLTPGLYFIKVTDNKGNASVQKFVKE